LRVFARNTTILFAVTILKPSLFVTQDKEKKSVKMAPSNLPSIFNATSQDIETLLAAQCHLGSKNLQVHMENYLWKTRQDGVNVINVGKTWYV
jgi:ribosomal protein S2